MPQEPLLHTLPIQQRARFFWSLVLIFIIALPVVIFHTTGYRLTMVDDRAAITPTGGIYLTTMTDQVEVFVDEQRVASPRLFRSAYYVQNVPVGQRRIVVQGEGLQTWVKELPIDPYLVTEAAAFTTPERPQIRLIHQFETATGTLGVSSTSTPEWLTIPTTTIVLEPTTLALPLATSSQWQLRDEHSFVASLFGTTTRKSLLQPPPDPLPPFRFATTTEVMLATTTVSESIVQSGIELFERDGEVYAGWVGSWQRVPYYFCILDSALSTIATRYGEHVADQVADLRQATTSRLLPSSSGRVCRPEIRLDRMKQDVFWLDFMPGQRDVVLLLLEDGLYVTEIDDRSWQNSQRILAGDAFQVAVFGSRIYVKEGDWLAELILTIES